MLSPELPLHGERRLNDMDRREDIVADWQEYWSTGGAQTLLEEWIVVQTWTTERFPGLPIGYFGLSLATQYGIPLLAGSKVIRRTKWE